ncbi:hypothetical protein LX64_00473 [Chitinophaga skermanii]|uniref:Uncharacterized protein n=1 Tax=Chitinophaga skermanii TaxID=331697 RepID=A0A327R235_9BACT|nr:hypothetical protein [Chitinophaga skermanii]RAJ10866.1 hypothetical protein LX64_00473 [Chitinophaga skermanii]
MKQFILAFACLAIGFSANAANPKSSTPPAVKVEVKTTQPEIRVEEKQPAASFFRIQKRFDMWDACGQMISVWVSAPNGTAWDTMYSVAIHHVMDCLNSNGCYQ